MKTIKINDLTHKEIIAIKNYFGYKTIDETIDMAIGEFIIKNGDGYIQKIIRDMFSNTKPKL